MCFLFFRLDSIRIVVGSSVSFRIERIYLSPPQPYKPPFRCKTGIFFWDNVWDRFGLSPFPVIVTSRILTFFGGIPILLGRKITQGIIAFRIQPILVPPMNSVPKALPQPHKEAILKMLESKADLVPWQRYGFLRQTYPSIPKNQRMEPPKTRGCINSRAVF